MELNELKKSNEKKESEEMQKVNIIAGTKLIDGVNINGVTYAPVRELSELLGKKVEWDQKTSTVTLK
ncbi:stalk domain-containing protein [Schinkia azotoformans]